MALTPEDIERREFAQTRRGYDPDEVRQFLREVAASQRSASAAEPDASATRDFSEVGEQVASVLASAHRSALSIEEASRARVERLEAEAEAERDDAARLRARAETLLVEAERDASAMVDQARETARATVEEAEREGQQRAAEVLAGAQQRLDELLQAEHQVYERLLAAAADVNEAIERVAGPAGTSGEMDERDALVESLVEEPWSQRASAVERRIVGTGSARPPLQVPARGPLEPVLDLTDRGAGQREQCDPAEASASPDRTVAEGTAMSAAESSSTQSGPDEGGAGGSGPQDENRPDPDESPADPPRAGPGGRDAPGSAAPSPTRSRLGDTSRASWVPRFGSEAAGGSGDDESLRAMVFETVGSALRRRH